MKPLNMIRFSCSLEKHTTFNVSKHTTVSKPPGPGPPGPQLIDVTGNMIKHSDAGTILDAIVGLSLHIDFNVMLPTHYGS